ncbi:MAG: pilus assembly protein N-terminal domain-containing protein [Proteobacteria bacterium]|nr:pilus assembly protein N-terminal domain-containing protein [Pseudomonadota bacterium]
MLILPNPSPQAASRKTLNILTVSFLVLCSKLAMAIPLSLGVGQQEALTFESLAKSVSVDRSGILDIQKGDTKSVVVITGKSEGFATLKINLYDGKTVVYDVTVSKSTKNSFSNMISSRRMPV